MLALERSAERARERFDKLDQDFVRELVTYRQQLTNRAPVVDDPEVPYPEVDGRRAPSVSFDHLLREHFPSDDVDFDAIEGGGLSAAL